jgi:integrase
MKFTIFESSGRAKPFGVRYWLDRKTAVRTFYATRPEAEARQAALAVAFTDGGLEAVQAIDRDAEIDQAIRIAKTRGESLLAMVQRAAAITGSESVVVMGPTLRDAFAGFERRGREVGLRPKTAAFYFTQLWSFIPTVGELSRTGELTRQGIRTWIDSKQVGSRPHALRAIRAWIRWMQRQEPPMISSDPTAGMGIDRPLGRSAVRFLTTQEAERLLGQAKVAIRPALALMLFAGIRHFELHRDGEEPGADVLRWRDIDRKAKTITVRAEVAKTRVARTLRNVPANLWAWLTPVGKPNDPVCAGDLRQQTNTLRRDLGLPWSKSILRHTCASHHAAAFEDLSATALLLRHEGDVTLLNRRYREGVAISKADGLAFFALTPKP